MASPFANGSLTWQLAGEPVELLAERALFWPARRYLMIADLHLGKGDVFRRAGIALPKGGTQEDLARLSSLVQVTQAQGLWILGDLLHGAVNASAWVAQWTDWCNAHRLLDIAVISGNHDRALARAAQNQLGSGFRLLGDGIEAGPFRLQHHPTPQTGHHVICGHLHPVGILPGIRQRWPSFWLRPQLTVLPAFSLFTGGLLTLPAPDETLVVCAADSLLAVPGRRFGQRSTSSRSRAE